MNIRIIGKEDIFTRYVKDNFIIYIIILAVFAVGIVVGTIYYSNSDGENLSSYLESIISGMSDTSNIDAYEVFKESMIKNVGIAVLFLILGASVIGIPLLIFYFGYKGFTLGFTISTFIGTFGLLKGNIISFSILFFQNLFILFAMLIAFVSGVKIAINLLIKRKDMKFELIRHFVMCLFSLVFLLIGSAFEIFFNSYILKTILTKM